MTLLRRVVAGAAAFVVASAWLAGARVAHAAPPDQAAWWYKVYTSFVPARPSPPNVPAGGLFVQQDASSLLPPVTVPPQVPPIGVTVPNVSGPTAFASLRVTTPRGSPATLTLKLATVSTALNADIVACNTISPWQPPTNAGPGPYDQAPSYSCAQRVPATVKGSEMTWQLPTSMQFASGTYDIALVPNPANKGVFAVAFDAPSASSVIAGAPGSSSSSVSGGEAAPAAGSPLELGASGQALAGLAGGVPPVSGLAAPPVVAPYPNGGGTLNLLPPARRLRQASNGISEQSQRELAVGLLFGLMVAWWYVGGQSQRAPRLLGALAAGRGPAVIDLLPSRRGVRGIGRFTKPRSGPAPRLR